MLGCRRWAHGLIAHGHVVYVAAITDYEVRRELIRMNKRRSLLRLDSLLIQPGFRFLPLSTPAMRLAAELWADARTRGRPTADPQALDADVILAASVREVEQGELDGSFIVASTNVVHLSRFVRSARWEEIDPADPIP